MSSPEFRPPQPGYGIAMTDSELAIRSIASDGSDSILGQSLVAEYVEATALEMGVQKEIFVPFIEGYQDFPGAFAPPGDFLLAFLAGQPAGCVGIRPAQDGLCEMKTLWVREPYRGRGIAKELVVQSLRRAHELGFTKMGLDVLPSRKPAISLYRKLGFVDCPVNHDFSFEMAGFCRDLESKKPPSH